MQEIPASIAPVRNSIGIGPVKSAYRNVAFGPNLRNSHITIIPSIRTRPLHRCHLLWQLALVASSLCPGEKKSTIRGTCGNSAGDPHNWRFPQCFGNVPIQIVRNPLRTGQDDFIVFMRVIRRTRNLRARILSVTSGFANCAQGVIRLSIPKANAC